MPPPKCIVCNLDATGEFHKCPSCKVTRYCSTRCRSEDYPVHFLICNKFEAVADIKPEPPTSHKLVILLSENHPNPRFMWMPTKLDKYGCEIADISALGKDFAIGQKYTVGENLTAFNEKIPRFNIDHNITMYACKSQSRSNCWNAAINVLMNRRAPAHCKSSFHTDVLEYSEQRFSALKAAPTL